jgi:hypothetical protein
MICELRKMVAAAATSRAILEGVQEGNLFFVDPLWDPLRYEPRLMLSANDLSNVIRDGTRLIQLAGRLLEAMRGG